ncbi:hypothetical protein D3C75_395900 [compost metagenome]
MLFFDDVEETPMEEVLTSCSRCGEEFYEDHYEIESVCSECEQKEEKAAMKIEIYLMLCPHCNNEFHELRNAERDNCPICNANITDPQPTELAFDDKSYKVVIDPGTGVPRIEERN